MLPRQTKQIRYDGMSSSSRIWLWQRGAMTPGTPTLGTPAPRQVRALAGGASIRPVWENELGGLTFELMKGTDRRFVKWTPASSGIDLDEERVRLDWAARYVAVPVTLDHGGDADSSWLVTAALPGQSAVAPRWLAEPETAVEQIGAGLRALHDRLPVEDCPFTASAEERLAETRGRAGRLDPATWNADHQHLTVDEALRRLADVPPVDRLVVCHGDTCAPNTLLTDDGRWSGHVDLGQLGVADRWADLAVATWSTQWNYGAGWEERLLEAYGVPPDPDRTHYYRLLWGLGP